jgi:hypothetical protein
MEARTEGGMIKYVKRLILTCLLVAGVLLLGQLTAEAAITGQACVDCHTMHNSQDGVPMTSPSNPGDPPNDYLLLLDCLQCHTRTDGSGPLSTVGAPAVMHSDAAAPHTTGNYLAGGSFWYPEDDDAEGHNVTEITTPETTLGDAPGDDNSNNFTVGVANLSCVTSSGSGTQGCHVGGGHHSNKGGSDGTGSVIWVDGTAGDVGDSYRFLSGAVKGGEHSNWEYDQTDEDSHNLYYTDGVFDAQGANSITAVCIECHGDFHGITNGTSPYGVGSDAAGNNPWIRHPTDFSLLAAGAHAEHASYGTYSVQVPIGTSDDVAASNVDISVGAGGQMANYDSLAAGDLEYVICQSCHRAHGSQHADMLRFTYADMIAGTTSSAAGTGCFKCHTQKDG